jgi:glycosyltransferase involved in cell wall biosynthesis
MARVGLGLPVFNGERFLAATLESVLAQTFTDFELVICDNASTDSTEAICRMYAARDSRIRYLRNKRNIGLSANFTRGFNESTGEFFKWVTYDDLLHPDFLRRCVEVLESHPTVVLVHSKTYRIDDQGQITGAYDFEMDVEAPRPAERFRDLVFVRHSCNESLGLIRRSTLAKTPLQANYVGSDRVLVAELGLHGRIHILPDYLFYRRDHSGTGSNMPVKVRVDWFDPENRGKLKMTYIREVLEYGRAVGRSQISLREKGACYRIVFQYGLSRRRILVSELKIGVVATLMRSSLFRRLYARRRPRSSNQAMGDSATQRIVDE